jgi:hypothetical protein
MLAQTSTHIAQVIFNFIIRPVRAKGILQSLDYLVGASSQTAFDKRTLGRIQELEQLEEDKKQTLYDLIDTYIRDAKARRAYSL